MNRKGITPVIAIILLLMITVAGAGAAGVWIMHIQNDLKTTTIKRLETKLEVLQSDCEAGTPNLNLILINSGKRPVDMIPFDIIVYNSGGKVTSLTRTRVNETYISDSAAWKEAQTPGGYTGEVTITMNDDFIEGEYYSSILLRFPEADYEIETTCQAQ